MFNHFNGKIIQVIEVTDLYDACSNFVLNVDKALREHFGIESLVYAKSFPVEHSSSVISIDRLEVNEQDILIYHAAGYSKHCLDEVIKQRCLKILYYHNITPHTFFKEKSYHYDYCLKGREQLRNVVHHFDLFSGASNYNLEEIVEMGGCPERCYKLPIIVNEIDNNSISAGAANERNNILFVGRVCENKRQDQLVISYARLKKHFPDVGKLILVGGYDSDSDFYKKIQDDIKRLNLSEHVVFTGKISQQELDKQYQQALCFISFSEHEGFGVPLIEAAQHNIPVLALSAAAVPETLENSLGLFIDENDLLIKFESLFVTDLFKQKILAHQELLLAHNSYHEWLNKAAMYLNYVIGSSDRFKKLSFVICTYNRADYLDRCLDYLTHTYNSDFEVIVVNGPSTDHTMDVIEKWRSKIIYADNPVRNLSISRNIGINLSSGDIVAFIDDDAMPFNDWCDKILDYYNTSHNFVGGVGGPTYYAGTLRFQAKDILADSYGSSVVNPPDSLYKDLNYQRTLLGTNSSFRRDYLIEIKGFDEEYDYFLDETDVCFRLIKNGYKVQHCSDAFLRHEFAQSDNRVSQYKFNWFSIVKNTVYFALRFDEKEQNIIISEVKKLIEDTRISYLKAGLTAGELSQSDFDDLSRSIWDGFEQGCNDALKDRRLLISDKCAEKIFKPFKQAERTNFIKRHIVIVSKEFPPFTKSGGIGTLYYHLASEFLLQGHDVTVITQNSTEQINNGNFKLIGLPSGKHNNKYTDSQITNINLNWSLDVAKEIDELNEYKPVSIVDTCLWDFEGYAFSLIKDDIGIPLVVRLVTPLIVADEMNKWNMPLNDRDLLSGFEREMISNANAIVPISQSIQNTFIEKYDFNLDSRFSIINAGIAYWPSYDISQGYQSLTDFPDLINLKQQGSMVFLYVGRLEKRKGVDVLIDAIKQLSQKESDILDKISFVFAGSDQIGLEKVLTQELQDIKPKVIYLGEVSDWDREKLYAFSDVVIFPSRYESFGLVPLEAFVHGKPVIGSHAGAIPEVVLDGQCGLIFEDGSAEDLTEKIVQLYSDKELYIKLAKGAKERVKNLSSNLSAVQSSALYNSLISSNES